ncbi:MAG: ABC transporter ATP-binding protein [Gammaproteobacteria bacterium]|nr:ABC transporter ATP-binding protein [Gammaproteobacteria bacterium]
MLSIRNLSKSYRSAGISQAVLQGLDFDMAASTSVALLGDSGSGKSTLLHLVAGLDRPDGGSIEFAGKALHSAPEPELAALRRSRLSLVFQQFHLIPTLDVLDNIRFQAALCGKFDDVYQQELVERLGLDDQLDKFPWQLSRGQQQRVAIARALLHRPELVLADEPTGNLDERSSSEVMALFSELVQRAGSALLMVTHSREMAAFLDRRVRLHDGRLTESE